MSRNQFDHYMPSDYFSRQTLVQTSHLLRKEQPALSHLIEHALEQIPIVEFEELKGTYTGEMLLNLYIVEKMKAHVIGRIVSCLTDIGQKALTQQVALNIDMTQMRGLIEDWMQLTEWILQRTSSDNNQDQTQYQ